LIPLIGISLFAELFRNLFADLLIASGDISFPSWSLAAESFFRLGLIIFLLSVLGVIGVPVAIAISCVWIAWMLGRRFFIRMGIVFSMRTIVRTIAVCAVFVGVAGYGSMQMPVVISSWIEFAAYAVAVVIVLTLFITVLYREKVMLIWRNI